MGTENFSAGQTDAETWAKEFCERYTVALCQEGAVQHDEWEDIMRGWFANAIEAGRIFGAAERDYRDREMEQLDNDGQL